MRSPLVAAAFMLLVPSCSVIAQEIRRLEPGMRVRVTAPELGLNKHEGTVGAVRGDTLFLANDSTVSVPATSMTRLEVSRGTKSQVGKGALIGGAIGAALGIAVGVYGQGLCGFGEGENCWTAIPLVGLAGAVAGAGVGALLGVASGPADRWMRVSPYIVRVAASARGGVRVGLSIAF